MNVPEPIVRVAAKGDGVTDSGRHVPFAAPGDAVSADGGLILGRHHAVPPCQHFGRCGGCQLQHLDEESWSRFVTDRVALAARGQGIEPRNLAPPHLSPPRSRRRATLHAAKVKGECVIGFREAGSHRIVDMRECHVLRPELFALAAPLRRLLSTQRGTWAGDIELASIDQGIDCSLRNVPLEGLEATEAVLAFAQDCGLARLSVDLGYGPETIYEPVPATVTLGSVSVPFPAGAFLQATTDGEHALTSAAREWTSSEAHIADLFAGLGTFAFSLAGRADAFEAARDAHLACRMAAGRTAGRVAAYHRDLFRNPLAADELATFDAVVLDPPRAGAREQVAQIAASGLGRVIYVSCNPSSWAKDARTLIAAGFALEELRPVGQFRWSTHVELASLFTR